jgi:type IV pilus assembly protein PilM
MAKPPKNLIGLDIDPSGIAAAQVRVNGRITVDRAAVAPLEPGILRDGEVVDTEGLSEALRALWRDNKGLGKRVRVGVANQKIVVRVLHVPPTENAAELDAAVRFQAQDQLPMPLDKAVLDYVPLEPEAGDEDNPGARVLLVAARRDMVENVLSAVRSAGLKPMGIDLSAFAMVRALRNPGLDDEPVLYLAIGGVTNIAVARGRQCIFTRVSGSGLEGLVVDLAEREQLTLEHSRGWLSHVGLVEPVEAVEGDASIVATARQVLLDGVRRIGAEVRNSLDFHSMSGGSGTVSRAVVTGPAAAVPGFAEALQSELSLPVECGLVDGAPSGIAPSEITVAAGLAVHEVAA